MKCCVIAKCSNSPSKNVSFHLHLLHQDLISDNAGTGHRKANKNAKMSYLEPAIISKTYHASGHVIVDFAFSA